MPIDGAGGRLHRGAESGDKLRLGQAPFGPRDVLDGAGNLGHARRAGIEAHGFQPMGGPAHGLPVGCGHGLVDGRASGLRMGLPQAEDAGGEIGAAEPRHGGKLVELVAADEVVSDDGRG